MTTRKPLVLTSYTNPKQVF